MKTKYYVIRNQETKKFLDGFKADGSPVWKSNLQSIDPLPFDDAQRFCKETRGEGKVMLVKTGRNCETVLARINFIEHSCVRAVKIKIKRARTEGYEKAPKVEPILELRFDHGNATSVEAITLESARMIYEKLKKRFNT